MSKSSVMSFNERLEIFQLQWIDKKYDNDVIAEYENITGGAWPPLPEMESEIETFFDRVGVPRSRADVDPELLVVEGACPTTPPNTATGAEATLGVEHRRDAGIHARMKFQARQAAARFMRKVIITISVLTGLLFVCTVAMGYYLWQNKVTTFVTDERACSLKLSDNFTVTGKRTYSYPYTELLGIGWREVAKVDIRTKLDIPMKGIAVVGLVEGKPIKETPDATNNAVPIKKKGEPMWWSMIIGQGEGGVRILKNADVYVFHVGNDIGAVSSASFCR